MEMISQVRIYFQQALQTQFDLYPLPFIPNHSWLLLEVCIWHTVPRQWDSRLNAQALELSRPKCCPHLTLILENQSPQVLFFFFHHRNGNNIYLPCQLCTGNKVWTVLAFAECSWSSVCLQCVFLIPDWAGQWSLGWQVKKSGNWLSTIVGHSFLERKRTCVDSLLVGLMVLASINHFQQLFPFPPL